MSSFTLNVLYTTVQTLPLALEDVAAIWHRQKCTHLRMAYLDMGESTYTSMFLQPSCFVHVRISLVIESETAVMIRYTLRCRLGRN